MLWLITGGSGSGKSEYAEQKTAELGEIAQGQMIYIATMEPYDEESYKRIERHRHMRRNRNFITIECYTHLEDLELEPTDTVLLECVSNLTANEMYSEKGRGMEAGEVILQGIRKIARKTANIVIVGNNVFEDGIIYDSSTQEYLRQMAVIQKEIAKEAQQVTEVVCGIPITIKEERSQQMEVQNTKIQNVDIEKGR